MIKFLKHELIDKEKWDFAIDLSINGYIYANSYFLDVVAENQWDALVMDDYDIVMPLPYRVKYGIKYVYHPMFNQQLGLFYSKNCADTTIRDFMEAIPSEIKFFELNFNKYLLDRVSQSFIAATNANFELELMGDYDKIHQNYSSNLKRNLKKATNFGLKLVNNVRPEDLVQLFKNNKGSQLKVYQDSDYQRFIKLAYLLLHHGKAIISGVINENNTIIAAALFVKSHGRTIFLFSGLSIEGKEKSAMPFLIDKEIQFGTNFKNILDFEGSNNSDLARFYASFGAKQYYYQRVMFNKLPFPLKQIKQYLTKTKV